MIYIGFKLIQHSILLRLNYHFDTYLYPPNISGKFLTAKLLLKIRRNDNFKNCFSTSDLISLFS